MAADETSFERLTRFGMAPSTDAAVQIDITAVLRRSGSELVETYLCDHNCTVLHKGQPTGGHYNCPAALSLNRGAVASTIAGADLLVEGIERTLAAAREAQQDFITDEFDRYADESAIPAALREPIRSSMRQGPSEVTLFGGSPEAHPDFIPLVEGLHRRGHAVHLTVTGRRAVRSPESFERMASSGIAVLAVSADDVATPADLGRLLQCDPEELRTEWKRVSPFHGQRQKVYEAIHAARLWQRLPVDRRPALLFNIAVHPGNVADIDTILTQLAGAFPGALLNPFPMQSAFEGRIEHVDPATLRGFRSLVNTALEMHRRQAVDGVSAWSLAPRMHYWLLLSAALGDATAPVRLTGWNTWKCYRSNGAGRYVQIAGTGRRPAGLETAGGRVGCFWNDTVNDDDLPAVWEAKPSEIRRYLQLRPVRAAEKAHRCAGCLFPRLVGDMVSLESGMDPALREAYLSLRRRDLGF
ncbi:hypothetical protein [Glycomyces buryatensis]|uniref:Radical SAM protein n=1 Tax=Glycomyces buryatensis TaxID=2570927 RepID=A0A4S8Q0Z3_9ACTN|nr:hypothetical protein [Glycomyces buryatensis]THV37620.1 hypothetical protein FAB82_20295 [Glycomyces buryatensis]